MSGLSEYLVQKRAAFHAIKAATRAPGYTPPRIAARVSAEGRSGIRRIRIRDFQIVSDAGPEFAGYNLGPTSPEIVLGALGSCITHTFLIQAAVLDIPLDAVDTAISGQIDGRAGSPDHPDVPVYPHDLSYTVTLSTNATGDEVDRLHAAVERTCPILNLLRRGHSVPGRVVVAAATAAARMPALSAVGTP